MSDNFVKTTELAGNVMATDMSILGLLQQADIVVKLVILLLVLASFWGWSVIFDKLIRLKAIKEKMNRFEKVFWSGQLLDQLYERVKARIDHPMAAVFVTAMQEWGRYKNLNHQLEEGIKAGIKERVLQTMQVACNREMDKLYKHLGFLATIGSAAPFIGLFGTVWGIMNSFQSIAATKNTTLAVVAPGIAEALLATAIGLLAAIPASIFYNYLNGQLHSLEGKIEDFSMEIRVLLSRELDNLGEK